MARGEEEEFNFHGSLAVFNESRKVDIGNRFRKEADAYYVEAKRSTVSSISQVPMWMYGVMLLLGWNEIMAVFRSPVYFTFLLLLLGAAYVVWRLNLQGPLQSVVMAIAKEVHRLADDQLRSHFSQPLPQPAMLRDHIRQEEKRAAAAAGNSSAAPVAAAPATATVPASAPAAKVVAPAEEIELQDRKAE